MRQGVMVSVVLGVLAWAAQDAAPKRPALPEVGENAPAFRLNDHEGDVVAVGGAGDRWTVLAWYPKARTPG